MDFHITEPIFLLESIIIINVILSYYYWKKCISFNTVVFITYYIYQVVLFTIFKYIYTKYYL